MRRSPLCSFVGVALMAACTPGDDTSGGSEGSSATVGGESDTSDSQPTTSPSTTSPEPEPSTTAMGEPTGSDSNQDTELPQTETDTEVDTTDGDGPTCPNGILDEGEQCDDGVLDEDGPCLPGCLHNICGDGFIHTGVEACDAGPQNGAYAGICGADCTVDAIPHCGDGIVQDGFESCEGNETNQEGVACDPEMCQWGDYRYVFVTSRSFTGDLASELVGNNISGVTRADTLCQVLAVGAGLPGSYYAWLSDNNGLAGSNAGDRIGGAQNSDTAYVMPGGGGLVAHSWDELTSTGPLVPILWTEEGVELDPAPTAIWSNTSAEGTSLGQASCGNWSLNDELGWAGLVKIGPEWTDKAPLYCDEAGVHLYCFEGVDK